MYVFRVSVDHQEEDDWSHRVVKKDLSSPLNWNKKSSNPFTVPDYEEYESAKVGPTAANTFGHYGQDNSYGKYGQVEEKTFDQYSYKAYDQYSPVEDKGYAQFGKNQDKAYAKYDQVEEKAFEKYSHIENKAYDKYSPVEEKAYGKYSPMEDKAYDQYGKIQEKAYTEYHQFEKAYDEYGHMKEKAYDKYSPVKEKAFGNYSPMEDKAYDQFGKIQEKAYTKYDQVQEKAFDKYSPMEEKAYGKYSPMEDKDYDQYGKSQENAYTEYDQFEKAYDEYGLIKEKAYGEYSSKAFDQYSKANDVYTSKSYSDYTPPIDKTYDEWGKVQNSPYDALSGKSVDQYSPAREKSYAEWSQDVSGHYIDKPVNPFVVSNEPPSYEDVEYVEGKLEIKLPNTNGGVIRKFSKDNYTSEDHSDDDDITRNQISVIGSKLKANGSYAFSADDEMAARHVDKYEYERMEKDNSTPASSDEEDEGGDEERRGEVVGTLSFNVSSNTPATITTTGAVPDIKDASESDPESDSDDERFGKHPSMIRNPEATNWSFGKQDSGSASNVYSEHVAEVPRSKPSTGILKHAAYNTGDSSEDEVEEGVDDSCSETGEESDSCPVQEYKLDPFPESVSPDPIQKNYHAELKDENVEKVSVVHKEDSDSDEDIVEHRDDFATGDKTVDFLAPAALSVQPTTDDSDFESESAGRESLKVVVEAFGVKSAEAQNSWTSEHFATVGGSSAQQILDSVDHEIETSQPPASFLNSAEPQTNALESASHPIKLPDSGVENKGGKSVHFLESVVSSQLNGLCESKVRLFSALTKSFGTVLIAKNVQRFNGSVCNTDD